MWGIQSSSGKHGRWDPGPERGRKVKEEKAGEKKKTNKKRIPGCDHHAMFSEEEVLATMRISARSHGTEGLKSLPSRKAEK